MSKPTTIDDFSFLSDEDIRLIYDIITTAEASSDTPFRALFAAYDKVLDRYGIAKDHDQVYFRFLLHMGEGRREGEGLFERFESLLAKLGLQVDFIEEEKGTGEEPQEHARDGIVGHTDRKSVIDDPRRVTRRASFDSAYETNADSRRASAANIAASPRPHSTDIIERKTSQQFDQPIKPTVRNTGHNIRPSNGFTKSSTRGRMKARDALEARIGHEPRRIAVSRSRERPQSPQQYLSGHPMALDERVASDISDENTDVESALEQDQGMDAQPEVLIKIDPIVQDVQQMELHARTLRYHHLAANAISLFRYWRRKAHDSSSAHQELLHVAVHRDMETLSRQAFDQWRSAFLENQHVKETERFFENLEVKATRARDLFLLTKAFTHWAQSTSEEVSRKTAARRHILQTRYFNAWREITVVNEIKVRRQRLHKFMSIWKSQTAHAISRHESAMSFCVRNYINRFYRRWFWQFCDRRAPVWYGSKLKSGFFSKWVDASRQIRFMETLAVDFDSLKIARRATNIWTTRAGVVRHNQVEAENSRHQKLLKPCIAALQREVTYAPPKYQVNRIVESHVIRSAINIWRTKTRMTFEANRVDMVRTKRNAWTMWNDRLRCQALSRKIDDRTVLQALYKWVLFERLALFQRIRDEKLKVGILSSWRGKIHELCASLGHAKHMLRQLRDQRARTSVIVKWAASTRMETERQTTASDFRARRQLTETASLWLSKLRHVQKLDGWSADARFYVLASGTMKHWQAASVANKRTKRREAYAMLRRKTKSETARNLLLGWRDAANSQREPRRQANLLHQTQLITLGTSLFTMWRTRTALLQQSSTQATALHAHHLRSTHFNHLTTLHAHIQTCHLRADAFIADTAASAAAGCLRKLNWQNFQLKRQRETAESLGERNRRKHYRNMVKYWAERTRERRRPTERVLFQPSAPTSAARFTPITRGSRGGPGAQVQFFEPGDDETLQDRSTVGPITAAPVPSTPGYLRTPSRHRTTLTSLTSLRRPAPAPSSSSFHPLPLPPLPSIPPQQQQQQQQNTRAMPATPATTHFSPFLAKLRGSAVPGSEQQERGYLTGGGGRRGGRFLRSGFAGGGLAEGEGLGGGGTGRIWEVEGGGQAEGDGEREREGDGDVDGKGDVDEVRALMGP